MGAGQAHSALDQFAPQCAELREVPQRRMPFNGVALLRARHHRYLTVVVVRQYGGKDKYPLAGPAASCNLVHLGLRLQFRKIPTRHGGPLWQVKVAGRALHGFDTLIGGNHIDGISL